MIPRGGGLLYSIPYSIAMGLGGMLVVAIVAVLLFGIVRSYFGKGPLASREGLVELAQLKYDGDEAEAAAHVRQMFPFALLVLSIPGHVLLIAFSGEGYFESEYFGVLLCATAGTAVWMVLERELGFPGVLVPPAARGTRGLLFARIAERRSRSRNRSATSVPPDPHPGTTDDE
jgi:hypothetical protein